LNPFAFLEVEGVNESTKNIYKYYGIIKEGKKFIEDMKYVIKMKKIIFIILL